MAGRGPRRTRVYDCNFNAGERYYKSALDSLDRKYNKRESAEPTRPKLNVDDLLDEDLQLARRRAERAITDDTFFDSRGAKIKNVTIKKANAAAEMENDIDEEVRASLNRIRANKKLTSNDLDLEETISTVKRRARIDLGEKLLDAAGNDEAGITIRRRALKMVTRASDDYVDPSKLTKWTAIESGNKSAAALRASETKNRLRELETDMFERSEKQLAREKRSANLKKFLVDSDIDTSIVKATEKKLRI